MVHLKPLKELRFLNLDATSVDGPGLALIADLTALETLSLSFCKLSDEHLAHLQRLPKLHKLSLHGCGLTDEALRHLSKVKSLTFLLVGPEPDHGSGSGVSGRDEAA